MPSAADKVVSIVFKGDDQVSKTIKSVSSSLNKFESVVGGVADPLARVGDSILKADAALAALAVGGLALGYKRSVDFESSLVELEKVLGDEIDALDDARKSAINLSNTYGTSSTAVLASTANFKQAGFNIREAMDLTKAALDLTIAGELDAAQASEVLIASLKGFDAPASEAARLIDILNEVSNNYATDVQELAVGMAELSPIAKAMGFSMEETAGLVTPVIEVFRSGSEASRALRTGLLKLTDDTSAVQEALAALGVSQKDANGQLRSGKEILLDVAQAFTTARDADKLFLTQQLVGIDQSAKMVTVFDNLAKTTAVTATAMDSMGSAQEEVNKRLASSEAVLGRLAQGWTNLAIAAGDQYREAVTGAAAAGTEVENVLQQMVESGAFDEVFEAVRDLAGDAEDFLQSIAQNLPEAFESVEFSGLLDALDDVGESIANLFDFDPRDPESLGDAIQLVVDTLESLSHITAGMFDAFGVLFDVIKDAVGEFNDLDDASKRVSGTVLGFSQIVSSLGATMTSFVGLLEVSGAKVGAVFDAIGGWVSTLWNFWEVGFSGIIRIWTGVVEKLLQGAELLTSIPGLDNINKQINDALKGLQAYRSGVIEEMKNDWSELKEGADQFWSAVSGGADEAKTKGQDAGRTLSDAFFTAEDDVSAIVASIAGTLEEKLPAERKMQIRPELDTGEVTRSAEEVSKIIEGSVERDLGIVKAETERYEALLDYRLGAMVEQGKTARAVAESVAGAFGASQDALSDLFGNLGESVESGKGTYFLRQYIEEQQKQAKALADAQAKNLDAQTKLAEAKAERAESGEAIIQIDGAGLQPHLEAFMYEILEAIQVRATEEGASFLLGT